MAWCTRHLIADPRVSVSVVSQMLDVVVEGNMRTFASPPETEAGKKLMDAVAVLNGKIAQEMTLQFKATSLAGLLESVL